jgi:hypothetical protein
VKPNALRRAAAALAASTRCSDVAVAIHYVAASKLAIEEARAELAQLQALLQAREAELVRLGQPAQLALDGGGLTR